MDGRIYLIICLTGLINLCLLRTSQASANNVKSVFVLGEKDFRQKRSENGSNTIDITEFRIRSKVQSRFATVDVYTKMLNKDGRSKEPSFIMQIPKTAFISKFSMVINGIKYVGKVYEKNEAQNLYEEAKNQSESAWHVSHQGQSIIRGMDKFTIEAKMAANSEVSFEVTYQELIERRRYKYIQRFNVQPRQIVPHLTVEADITESQGFKDFSFQLPNSTIKMTTSQGSAKLEATPTTRVVVYKPTVEEQREFNNHTGIDGEFVVTYDINQRKDGGVMVIKDDCFNHYVAPKNLLALNKNILFLIDISGSMDGDKIQQAREALLTILGKLTPEDVFNILVFSGSVRRWVYEPQTASSNNIAKAKLYVKKNVIAQGSTNINDALVEAVSSMKNSFNLQGTRASLIVFLTDGDPSSGVTDTKTIRKNVLDVNNGEKRIAIFSLAFGFNLDIEFLKELSWENGGIARRIYDDKDASSQLTDFYMEIQSPVLVDVNMQYDHKYVDPNDVTRTEYLQYFEGSEIVVAGKTKMRMDSPDKMDVSVVGTGKGGKVDLQVVSKKLLPPKETGVTCQLYAYLKIKDLLRQRAIASTQEEVNSFESKALKMSLKYGFVTPLTSLVIIQAERMKQPEKKVDESTTVYSNSQPETKGNDSITVYSNSPAFIAPSLLLYCLSLVSVHAGVKYMN